MKKKPNKLFDAGVWMVITWVAILLMAILMSGCKTYKVIDHDYQTKTDSTYETKRDTIIETKLVRDSIYVRDSLVLREKGDTIFSEKWHTKYIERLRIDTVREVSKDTVFVLRTDSVQTHKETEKQPSFGDRVRSFISDFGVAIGILGVLVLIAMLVKWSIKLRSRD